MVTILRMKGCPMFRRDTMILSLLILLAGTVGAQTSVVSITVDCGDRSAGSFLIGLAPGAAFGYDEMDIPEPPSPPESPLSAALLMFEDTAPMPNRWRCDMRPLEAMDDYFEPWMLQIESVLVGETCSLGFECLSGDIEWIDVITGSFLAQRIYFPGRVEFPVYGPTMQIMLEYLNHDSIPAVSSTWGAVKSLYR